jgi:hypothetical protein
MSKLGSLQSLVTSKRLVAFVAAISVVFVLVRVARAQTSRPHTSMVTDWSHRHVVFSRPTSWVTAWRLQGDIRYWQQTVRRSGFAQLMEIDTDRSANQPSEDASDAESEARSARDAGGREPRRIRVGGWPRRERLDEFHRDWGQSLGVNGFTGVPFAAPTWNPVYPAKFSFDVTATPSCANDFVVFTTNLAGVTGGQASIIAYRNLYSGTGTPLCGSANPTVYWSYNTNFNAAGAATTGTVASSPVLSLDGRKIAFVENRTAANGGAILHLLQWNSGDGGAISTSAKPTTATVWTADGAAGHCPVSGSCMISLAFNVAQGDTVSSPLYDYKRDVIYLGDDNGVLHKFVNVFGLSGATPSEVTTGNWPISVDINVATPAQLTSPTLDSVTGNIFVADTLGLLSYVRESFSTAGACKTGAAPCLGSTVITPTANHVVPDAPIVDSTTGKVFIFFGNDGGGGASVVQSDITLSASIRVSLGTGTAHHLHSGAFDNTYLTGNGSAGFLYMCGSSGTSAPTIQRIGFTNSGRTPASPFANAVGTMNAAVDAATLAVATNSAECSPLTEFFNANAPAVSRDQIFFGVQTLGSGTNCGGGGCVMSINVTGTPGSLSIANSIAEIGGPSGIVVDNSSTSGQASSLYFSNQGPSTAGNPCNAITGVGCAIKLTQAGLN